MSNDSYKTIKKTLPSTFKDSLSLINYVNEFQFFAVKKGHLLASIDSLKYNEREYTCSFYLGPKFKNAILSFKETDYLYLKKKGIVSEKLLRNLPFSPKELSRFLSQILTVYLENGYPFCSVKLNQIEIQNETLQANVEIKPQKQLKILKINLVGEPQVSEKFIYSYIQIKPGDLFNQTTISAITNTIKQISFIEEIKPSEILFTEEGVELFLYLKSKPVSLINGVVGLQQIQQNTITEQKTKYYLTGEIRLKLLNSLRKAELFDLNWRSIQPQTQALKIQINLPNLLQTPFGFDGQFQLYKRDTTFIEIKTTVGIQFAMKNGNYLKMFYRRNSTNILKGGENNPAFTNLKSFETNFYGLGFFKQKIDYLPNPRSGFTFLIEGTIGIRTSKDSIKTKENTSKMELQFQWYYPLTKRNVLKIANFTETYFAPSYFENEVYRFGGQNSLRGFNEEELYATARTVTTLEYRFILDQNSFVFVFLDQAWYENKAAKFKTDAPFGFGGGFAFGTNIGNFSVSYALGKQLSNKISFQDGKVHFGYISYF